MSAAAMLIIFARSDIEKGSGVDPDPCQMVVARVSLPLDGSPSQPTLDLPEKLSRTDRSATKRALLAAERTHIRGLWQLLAYISQ